MVTRTTSFEDEGSTVEIFDIRGSYEARKFNYQSLLNQEYGYYCVRFFKIKKIRGILDRLMFWIYPGDQFEFVPYHLSAEVKYRSRRWYGPRYHVLCGNDFEEREDIKSQEEVFDYFRETHPEIFEWILFNLEMF